MVASLALLFAACSNVADHAPCPPSWNYQQQELWPAACIDRPERSPINITTTTLADYPQIAIHYDSFVPRMFDNQRGVKFYADKEGGFVRVTWAERRTEDFKLQELHFHVRGEHTFNGKAAPMELHFVNEDEAGHAKVVVAVLFDDEARTANAGLNKIIPILPTRTCSYIKAPAGIDPMELLPDFSENKKYYVYDGALTNPECGAGLTFFVLDGRTKTNPGQIASIAKVIAPNAKTIAVRELPRIPVVSSR